MSAEVARPEASITNRSNSGNFNFRVLGSPTIDLPIEEIAEVDEEKEIFIRKVTPKSRTIFDDLNNRIKESYFNIENLSLAEQSTYQFSSNSQIESLSPASKPRSGSFSGLFAHNSDSDSSAPGSELSSPKPQSLYERRIRFNRPPPLTTNIEQNIIKESIYMNHLANYPDH